MRDAPWQWMVAAIAVLGLIASVLGYRLSALVAAVIDLDGYF